jgi:putative membrane protein
MVALSAAARVGGQGGVAVRLLVRLLAGAVALAVAAWVVDGISVGPGTTGERAVTLLAVAVIFGLVNAVVRPIVRLFTLPLFVVTLGLFTFVVNALMLLLTAWIGEQFELAFEVDGFVAALVGALVISVVSFLINLVLPDRYERR